MTTITAIISTKNSESCIVGALETVRAQTYAREKIDIIVVDRGSIDSTASLARWFFARHGMRGVVLAVEEAITEGGAMNLGCRAATGDWIQFARGDELLAPSKFERQISSAPGPASETRVIGSPWQVVRADGLRVGPVRDFTLDGSLIRLVSPGTWHLGAALFRRQSIEDVAGFSDELAYAWEERFMLGISGMGDCARLPNSKINPFAKVTSPTPLFFTRENSVGLSAQQKVGLAREHLENILLARTMLREKRLGMLLHQDSEEITRLCSECLGEIRNSDRGAYRRARQWLSEIDPALIRETLLAEPAVEDNGDRDASRRIARRCGFRPRRKPLAPASFVSSPDNFPAKPYADATEIAAGTPSITPVVARPSATSSNCAGNAFATKRSLRTWAHSGSRGCLPGCCSYWYRAIWRQRDRLSTHDDLRGSDRSCAVIRPRASQEYWQSQYPDDQCRISELCRDFIIVAASGGNWTGGT